MMIDRWRKDLGKWWVAQTPSRHQMFRHSWSITFENGVRTFTIGRRSKKWKP